MQILLGIFLACGKGLKIVEQRHELLIAAIAKRAQQRCGVEFAATAALVHETPHHVVGVEHNLNPAAAVGDDADRQQRLAVGVNLTLGGYARTAVQLRNDHPLRAVDNKRTIGGHHWHITEKHFIFADRIAVLQTEAGMQRARVRFAGHQRFKIALLRLAETVTHKIERIAPVVRRNRENLVENGLQTLVLALGGGDIRLQEIIIRLGLNLDQIRRSGSHPLKLAEYLAFCCAHLFTLCLFVQLTK